MSRIGKLAVAPVSGVTVTVDGQKVTARGPKGELSVVLADNVRPAQTERGVVVTPVGETLEARAAWGMGRAMIQNIVTGVTKGYEKKLMITGVGYRAQAQGSDLKLTLGYSHDIVFKVPKGVQVETPVQTEILIRGIDKQQVGQVAADIREFRPPEPYKGKGVRYVDEYVQRKEGKKK
ncbi:MAG: 50S ribosomal protein L6 [Cucumibacter sp.]